MYATPPGRILLQHLTDVGQVKVPSQAGADAWAGVSSGTFASDVARLVVLTDTGAFSQGRVMQTGERVSPPRVQVNLRAKTYPEGWAKVTALADYLSKIGTRPDGPWAPAPVSLDWDLGSEEQFLLYSVSVVSEPNFVGEDRDTKRQVFGMMLQLNLVQITPENLGVLLPAG